MQADKFPDENFSTRFSSLVRESPLSQKELAKALGVAESAIVNYKKGRTPKADELLRIAQHFEITMEWLLTGRGLKSLDETLKQLRIFRESNGFDPDNLDDDLEWAARLDASDAKFVQPLVLESLRAAEGKIAKLDVELKSLADLLKVIRTSLDASIIDPASEQ